MSRINVTFEKETFESIQNIANKQGISLSEVVRDFTLEGLKGTLGVEHIDLITEIIRSQLKSILNPEVERICALVAKTCITSATASFLSAETINRFVPTEQQSDVKEAYDAAYQKGIQYTKRKISL